MRPPHRELSVSTAARPATNISDGPTPGIFCPATASNIPPKFLTTCSYPPPGGITILSKLAVRRELTAIWENDDGQEHYRGPPSPLE
jgi:hypothetical protein